MEQHTIGRSRRVARNNNEQLLACQCKHGIGDTMNPPTAHKQNNTKKQANSHTPNEPTIKTTTTTCTSDAPHETKPKQNFG